MERMGWGEGWIEREKVERRRPSKQINFREKLIRDEFRRSEVLIKRKNKEINKNIQKKKKNMGIGMIMLRVRRLDRDRKGTTTQFP